MNLEKSRFNHLMSNSLEIQYLLTSFNPRLSQRSTCLILKTNIFKSLLQISFLSGSARLLGLERAVLQPLVRRGVHRPGGRHCLPVLRGDDCDDDCDDGDNNSDNDGDDGLHLSCEVMMLMMTSTTTTMLMMVMAALPSCSVRCFFSKLETR